MAFQYPVELPGVSQQNFLKESVNAVREAQGKDELGAADFIKQVRAKADLVDLDEALTKRSVNEGFSGGEKKRNEIFHLAMLEPRLAILDETDSGLDIDALRIVADGVNQLRDEDRAFIIITHYQRILEYIEPDYVHAMVGGRIAKSGDKDLAVELEERGYEWLSGGNAAENGKAAEPEEAVA
jgi:Fe-S cluster assembly ATP-binding protein